MSKSNEAKEKVKIARELGREDFIAATNVALFLAALRKKLKEEPGFFDAINAQLGLGILPQEKAKFLEAFNGMVDGLEDRLIQDFLAGGEDD